MTTNKSMVHCNPELAYVPAWQNLAFKTISVPPPQLSVPSVFGRWQKIYLCALGFSKACGMAIPAAIPFLAQQVLQPSNGIGCGNGCLCTRKTSWVSSQWAGILQRISCWKWQFCFKITHSLKIVYLLLMSLLYQDKILILTAIHTFFSFLKLLEISNTERLFY